MKVFKIFSIACALSASLVAADEPSKEALYLVAAEAIGSFETDTRKSDGQELGDKLSGITLIPAQNNMEVALFAKHSETQLKSSHYRCQSDGSVAQCQVDAQASVLIDYAAKNHQYTTAQFKTAVSEALELFGRKMSPTSTITRFKMWEGGDNLQLRIEWKAPTSNTPKTNFMSCHVHGAHFDCHRQAAAGPNEISN